MAYDFGVNTLGIQNPFKTEGVVRSISGLAVAALGIYPLLQVFELLAHDPVQAWVYALLGLTLLTLGFRRIGFGLFQNFKYFVGRSVPTSLAFNRNPSEKANAAEEKPFLAYDADTLESMLMGRKNATFVEPTGWTARLIHSLFPKLVFVPYPIRNLVQELGGLLITSGAAFMAFAVAYFVAVSGLAGPAGGWITPVLSVLLLAYVCLAWRASGNALNASRIRFLQSKSAGSLAKMIAFAIIVPSITGFLAAQWGAALQRDVEAILASDLIFNAWPNLVLLLGVILAVVGLVSLLVWERLRLANPVTGVSEFRDNMQESIHPNEVFINIENIVLANRRYKEIPNRTYRDFDPALNEQSEGKGSFKGQLLIETQPELQQVQHRPGFLRARMAATIVAQLFVFIGALLLMGSVIQGYAVWQVFSKSPGDLAAIGGALSSALMYLFAWITFSSGGRLLERGSHLFWAEMQFNSLLLWMKTEGTYTESKISTGMSIHDSTRSENTLVRSSITPWLITSRIISSTFATSGMQNVEMPRYVMQMTTNDAELQGIVGEIRAFLRGRENIASITNDGDLRNAETIFQYNQAARTQPQPIAHEHQDQRRLSDDEAGGARQRLEAEDVDQ